MRYFLFSMFILALCNPSHSLAGNKTSAMVKAEAAINKCRKSAPKLTKNTAKNIISVCNSSKSKIIDILNAGGHNAGDQKAILFYIGASSMLAAMAQVTGNDNKLTGPACKNTFDAKRAFDQMNPGKGSQAEKDIRGTAVFKLLPLCQKAIKK